MAKRGATESKTGTGGAEAVTALYVNGEKIEPHILDAHAQSLRQGYNQAMGRGSVPDTRIRREARENAIEQTLLLQEARKRCEVSEEEVNARVEELRKQGNEERELSEEELRRIQESVRDELLFDRLSEELYAGIEEPSEEACREYYEANRSNFMIPEAVHAAHIVRQPAPGSSKDECFMEMVEVRRKAAEGADFAAVAREHSQCDDGGGDLGWFTRGRMVESFEKIVFSLKPGEISEVFETEFGYHIATVYDHKPAGPVPFEDVKERIAEQLKEDERKRILDEFIDGLRENAVIEER